MPNGNNEEVIPYKFPELPEFPTSFGEEELKRMQYLEDVTKKFQKVYGVHYTPQAWREKSWIEKELRKWAEAAYPSSKWFREITPWVETGFTPEQARTFQREAETEWYELKRKKKVVERLPEIKEYLLALAYAGLLTGEEAQLYELIPELHPRAPMLERLELDEAEREWFLEYAKTLAKTPKDVLPFTTFPSPETVEEMLNRIRTITPTIDPRFILSSVAFSTDLVEIQTALQEAYPPRVKDVIESVKESQWEKIRNELIEKGMRPTGDVKEDVKLLSQAAMKDRAALEEKDVYFDTRTQKIVEEENPDTVRLSVRGNDVTMMGEKIARWNPETGELLQLRPLSEVMLGSYAISEYPLSYSMEFARSEPDAFRQAVLTEGRSDRTEQLLRNVYGEQIDEEYIDDFFQDNIPGRFVKGRWLPDALEDYWRLYWGGVGDLVSMVGSTFDRLGASGIANALKRIGYEGQLIKAEVKRAEPDTPEWYAQNLINMMPMMLAIIDATLLTAGGAGAVVSAAGGGGFLQTIVRVITAGAVSSVSEGALEAGDAYQEAERRGFTQEEKDAVFDRVLRHNVALLSTTNTAQFASTFFLPGGMAARWLVRALVFGFDVASEGLEEGVQLAIIREAFGDVQEFDEEMWQSIKLGLAGGGMFAGIGAAYNTIQSRLEKRLTQAQKDTINTDIQEGMSQGKSYKEAKAKAMNNFALTPEGEEIITETVEEVMAEEQEVAEADVSKVEQALKPALDTYEAKTDRVDELVEETLPKVKKKRKVSPEVRALRRELKALQPEIDVYNSSYTTAVERLNRLKEGRALPDEIAEALETTKTLKTKLDELAAERDRIQSRITELQAVPAVPEAVELTEDIWNRMTPAEREELGTRAKLGAERRSAFWTELFPEEKRALIRVYKEVKPPAVEEVKIPWFMTVKERFDRIDVLEKELKGLQSEQNRLIDEIKGLKGEEKIKVDKKISDIQNRIDAVVSEITGLTTPTKPPAVERATTGKPYTTVAYRGVKPEGIFPTDEGLVGKATYYTTNLEYAETYGEVQQVQINLENPLAINTQTEWDEFSGRMRELRERAAEENKSEDWVQETLRKELEAEGYDGVVIAPGIVEVGAQVAVFHPEKVTTAVEEVPAITEEKVKKLSLEELAEGQATDTETAEAQTKDLAGAFERTVDIEELEQTKEKVEEFLEEHLYGADRDNPLSEALVMTTRTGRVPLYIRYLEKLPQKLDEEGTPTGIDWDAHVSQDFKDAEFQDASMWNLNTMPFIDAVTYIDKGRFWGALRRKVYQIGDQAITAGLSYQGNWHKRISDIEHQLGVDKPHWWNFRRKPAWNEMFYAVSNEIASEDVVIDSDVLLKRKEISEPINKYSKKYPLTDEQKLTIVEYAKQIRTVFDAIISDVNVVRKIMGRKPIEYRKNYLPEVYKVNVWGRFLGIKLKPEHLTESALSPDWMKPSAPFNPRELERKGGLAGYEKVRDVTKLLFDYIAVSSRDMFYSAAISNAKAHARYLRKEKGLEVPAKYVEDRFLQTMAGMPDSLSRWVTETIPPWIINPIYAVRRRLNPAVFGINIPWNLFVQTSSSALLPLKGISIKSCIQGMQWFWNPKIRTWIESNVPAAIIKRGGRGSIVYQDLAGRMAEARRAERSPLETADEWMTFITKHMEHALTGVSAAAGYFEAKRKGVTSPDALVAAASDAAAGSQSMYDPFHLPGAYSPMVRLVVPFQTFCFEAITRVREMSGIKKFRAGAYEWVAADSVEGRGLIRNRVAFFLKFMVAIFLFNLLGELYNKRKPWQWSSFLPAANVMMYGADPMNPWNQPFPIRYGSELWKGFDAIIEYGNWKPIIYWATQWHFPAGSQVRRTLEGIIASIEGAQKDVAGEVMFEMEEGEWLKAVTLGVWKTESGQEWIKRFREGASPTTKSIIKEVEKAEELLGTSLTKSFRGTPKGEYYTLGNYLNDALELVRTDRPGVELWQILEDFPIYPELAMFAVHCKAAWEEYEKLPTDERLDYRREHPYIDATLNFWEQTRSLRSTEAKNELRALFEIFHIEDRKKAHWTGFPEIPDYIKLLPE